MSEITCEECRAAWAPSKWDDQIGLERKASGPPCHDCERACAGPRFVRIVCDDAIGRETRIIDPRTGKDIPGAFGVTWRSSCSGMATAEIEIYARVDVLAAVRFLPTEWPGKDYVWGCLP